VFYVVFVLKINGKFFYSIVFVLTILCFYHSLWHIIVQNFGMKSSIIKWSITCVGILSTHLISGP